MGVQSNGLLDKGDDKKWQPIVVSSNTDPIAICSQCAHFSITVAYCVPFTHIRRMYIAF